jgi:hypothetical protein
VFIQAWAKQISFVWAFLKLSDFTFFFSKFLFISRLIVSFIVSRFFCGLLYRCGLFRCSAHPASCEVEDGVACPHQSSLLENPYPFIYFFEIRAFAILPWPGLDTQIYPKFHYVKRRFPITSKCRYIYGVLNIDEIKN